jgi:adenosylmethionine-8-amino-7-oxononanoate aminotransferase
MTDDLRQLDLRYLWHPCTDIEALAGSGFPIIERADGAYLYERGGRALLDGISSWWCVNLGHSHPRIVEAIRRQAGQLQHCILGGMSHGRAIELAERLAGIAPGGLGHAFFAGDGSSAVEAALKIAVQYWHNRGQARRGRFIALADGYHGDTLGCVGVGYVAALHGPFRDVVRPSLRATSPHCLRCPMGKTPGSCGVECFASMQALIDEHHAQCAAVIVEPLCQGAAGLRMYPPEYLRRLRKSCDERGLLLIADEIAVGFGRCGTMFACEQAGVAPDLMTLGKGLTGGSLPMSAVLATDAVYDAFRSAPGCDRTFYHSHTFGGNPIAAAAALAAMDVYEQESVVESCGPRIAQLAAGIDDVAAAAGDAPRGSLGMMAVVELDDALGGAPRARRITARALELGLFVRPLGPCVYLWPPLTTNEAELAEMIDILASAARQTPV